MKNCIFACAMMMAALTTPPAVAQDAALRFKCAQTRDAIALEERNASQQHGNSAESLRFLASVRQNQQRLVNEFNQLGCGAVLSRPASSPSSGISNVPVPSAGSARLNALSGILGGAIGLMNALQPATPAYEAPLPDVPVTPAVDPLAALRRQQVGNPFLPSGGGGAGVNPFASTGASQGAPNPFAVAPAKSLNSAKPATLSAEQKKALADGVEGCKELERVASENRKLASGPGGNFNQQAAVAATRGAEHCWEAVGGKVGATGAPDAVTVATLDNLSDQINNMLVSEVLFGMNTEDSPQTRDYSNALKELRNRVNSAFVAAKFGSEAGFNAAQAAAPELGDEFEAILAKERERLAAEDALSKQVVEACGAGGNDSRCAAMVDIANSSKPGKCIDNWCYCPKAGGEWFATWCYKTSDPKVATKFIDAWGEGDIRNGEKGTNAIVRRDNPFPGAPASN